MIVRGRMHSETIFASRRTDGWTDERHGMRSRRREAPPLELVRVERRVKTFVGTKRRLAHPGHVGVPLDALIAGPSVLARSLLAPSLSLPHTHTPGPASGGHVAHQPSSLSPQKTQPCELPLTLPFAPNPPPLHSS